MSPTPEQLDGLTELINMGVGQGAGALNALLDTGVELRIPSLKVVSPDDLNEVIEKLGDEKLLAVNLPFNGKFSGMAELIFNSESATSLVKTLSGGDMADEDFETLREETIVEVGNIVLNGVMGAIGNILKLPLTFTTPAFVEGKAEELMRLTGVESMTVVLVARAQFAIKKLELEGEIILFFEEGSFNALLEGLVLSGIMTGY